ncbi:hypothetical protein HID58_071833 [Brassica napus]|uniref:Uncharacterized protein n=1 Tax=Brassica napus TaxID=3708 RepID=A0ABQ7Z2P6_BRANA|nr:hypothetical protein HID58_071833 [Brassica napus]
MRFHSKEDHNELLYCLVGVYSMVKRLKVLMVRTLLLFICLDVTWCWIGWSMSFDVRSREVSREEEEAREQREMEYRPPKQAISSKVYDLDLNGFTESQLRVVLSAFMILGHPDAVFNSQGDQEAALNDSAKGFLREFKLLIKVIKEGHVKMSVEESKLQMLRSQLDLFDKVWCAFLNSFVLWKFKDTRLLGEDKVRAACQLEISMIQKCKITPEGDRHCAHS